ncbi:MAG: thiamine pyrophosphate-dependent dehydrogenase E1 component subunit alpha [Desulfurellaceae bacterium]|nr:thiamine pyrophosphate-dependent dehydrogenase E1 component subunit alpha [Desulfurellaceae bacterium]
MKPIHNDWNKEGRMDIPKDKLLWIYERMQLIRVFETRVSTEFGKGKIPGFVHLYAGEEAVAVGICAHLTDADYMTSTHRGHGHCVAKGVDVRGMMAELFGKATGICKGKGGSMHIADMDKGMLGANGIVGGGPPLACGSGLTAKTNGTDQVTICFFGDGASEQGTLHESLNLAAIWKLPIIFVAENNGYAESTPAHYHCSVENIADRAAAYNMPGVTIDGNDLFAVYESAHEAVARARAGQGPSLLECKTYRHFGHFEGDAQTYKIAEENEKYRTELDPIKRFKDAVLPRGLISEDELAAIDQRVNAAIDEAVTFAEDSPFPEVQETFTDVYVNY